MNQTKSNSLSFFSLYNEWIVPFAIYITLASGAGNPIRCNESFCDFSITYLLIVVVLFFITPFIRKVGRVIPQIIGLVFFFLVLNVIGYFSTIPYFVYSKAWGGFLASGFALVFLVHILMHGGTIKLANCLCRISSIMLFVTLLYKIFYGGVFDRDIPYLMNGPIVFGWLMGLGGLCSIYILILRGGIINFLMLIWLSLGVLWSLSKGPILAYILSIIFLYFVVEKFNFIKIIRIFGAGLFIVAIVFIFLNIIPDSIIESRFGLLKNIYDDGINYSEGSIGVRLSIYESALSQISENMGIGIGSGAFAKIEPELMYPHNVHLEILIEYGIVIFSLYTVILVCAVVHGDYLIRTIVVFFSVCLSFSGDFSYLRFLLPFLILHPFRLHLTNKFQNKITLNSCS
jgi:hypothetical protein